MAADMRSFEAINIGMACVESGLERFTKDGHAWLPKTECWRINLTALSQRYNLYFMASANELHVYEPSFPFQKLGGKPCLTIKPQLANEHAASYIPSRDPHCINHILIGTLGCQEILLLATDSGNVVAYHTSSILSIIHRNLRDLGPDETGSSVALRPFFSQWVYESAWGLAIHEEARMIAVSANTPYLVPVSDRSSKITVFAFALSATEMQDEDTDTAMELDQDASYSSSDWVMWDPTSHATDTGSPTRDRNYKIVLAGEDGHARNIPCITFLGNKKDKEGSWLLSTDIEGGIKMWRIWNGKCFRKWNYSVRTRRGLEGWAQSSEPGWFVAALDTHAFRPASTYNTLIGHHHARQYYGHDAAGESFDITRIVEEYVPSNSIDHPSNHELDVDDRSSDEDAIFEDMSDSEVTADEEEAARAERVVAEFNDTLSNFSQPRVSWQSSSARRMSFLQEIEAASGLNSPRTSITTDDVPSEEDDSDGINDDSEQPGSVEARENTEFELTSDFSVDEASDTDDNDGSNPSPRSIASISSYNPGSSLEYDSADPDRVPGKRLLIRTTTSPRLATSTQQQVIEIPETPFIHCSSSQLRLFESTKARSPHLFCARMLRQSFPPEMEGMPFIHMDRLSIVEQIPEIGVVIIASQAGRCAVCTMTKRKEDGTLGLRVDWILPTKDEERAGLRPSGYWLQGIAVSPVQGRFPIEKLPSSEHNDNENQPTDRIVNGISTTFENLAIDLSLNEKMGNKSWPGVLDRGRGSTSFENDPGYRYRQRDGEKDKPIPTKPHCWARTDGGESWRGIESSRRFRLMMTYADMTVLTYEISRGVEKHDTKVQIRA